MAHRPARRRWTRRRIRKTGRRALHDHLAYLNARWPTWWIAASVVAILALTALVAVVYAVLT